MRVTPIKPGIERAQAAQLAQADEARRAALNLMEDAIAARKTVDHLNEELKASEARFREMIEALPAAVYTTDAQGLVTHFNSAAVRLAGRTPILGTDEWCVCWKLYRADGTPLPHDECPMAVALREGRMIRDVEAIAERPDGTRIWVEPYPTPLFDAQGKIVGGINMVVDITARKQTETAIRESEQRHRLLTSVLTDVPWTRSPAGEFVAPQPAWMHYTGQSWDDCRGFGWADAMHPEDRETVLEGWRHASATGSLYESHGRLWHAPSGAYRHFVARAVPVTNDDGSVREWVGTCTDVHERTRAAQALRESEERFRALADNISQLAWIADAHGAIHWFNQRWYDYTGATPEAMVGDGWKDVLHPGHREQIIDGRERALLAEEPWEDTCPMRGSQGTYRWFLSRCRPIHDAGGKLLRWFGTSTDVTERREMEERIQQQADQLADESRRKDEFLAMLSHELRNPLAPIRSAIHVLRVHERGKANPLQQKAHEIIDRQVSNLTKLVSDLLEVSRVISGRIHLNQQAVDLNEVVRHAVETAKPSIDQRRHELVVGLCEVPAWIHADATRMEEIFTNLLNNAAKFTEDGGRIEVHCELDAAASTVRVRVRDTGVGIDAKLLPRIFELFTQADRSLARSAGGLGIGLALAHRLTTLHGGTIEVRSPPRGADRGTEFIVTLPHVPGREETTTPRDAGTNRTVSSDKTLKVLVVDDNIDQVTMLSSVLQNDGHQIRTAHTGPNALSEIKRWHPDVVLLDIGLPELDGYEVARQVRADPDTRATRLIAISGYARDTDVARSRAAGFDVHLAKPLEFSELMKLMTVSA